MRSCPHCRAILSDSAAHCPADGAALSDSDPRIGALLSGQYQLLARVGEGGSGEVYRAWQHGVERQVAIKILSAGAASSAEFAARFLREAQAAARLSHANIITVFHIGRTADSLPFIAMEWVAGGPLGQGPRAAQQRSPEVVREIAKQIASALAAAHSAKIVHRDLKPDNLLVSFRNDCPRVTVVDFGIAKVSDGALLKPGETNLTKVGTVYGTPQYLAPEQACGKPVDERSDLYSLGVVLYQLLAGRLPFSSKGVALLVDHIHTEVPDLLSLAPAVPADLAALIMSMLAKEPDARPQSAGEVLAILEGRSAPVDGRAASAASSSTMLPVRPLLAREAASLSLGLEPQSHLQPSGRRLSIGAAILCLCFLALGSGDLGGHVAEAGALPQAPAYAEEPADLVSARLQSPALQGPQRALMVSADGYALRVLMPEELRAESAQGLAIEVWDRMGRPLALPTLVVLFADEEGQSEGVVVPSGPTLGRYELSRSFARSGAYSMQVLTKDAEVALRVHFEVAEAASGPNS